MPKVLIKKDSYFRYLLFAGITVFAVFISVYLISELVSKFYFVHQPIVYKINSQTSINAESWFENWVEGGVYSMNRGFVEKTCYAIGVGKYKFQWDYNTYCEMLNGK